VRPLVWHHEVSGAGKAGASWDTGG
jgi:hypothetical protein